MKHKRFIGLALVLGVFGTSAASVAKPVFAKAEMQDLANQTFEEFVLSDTSYEGELNYTYSALYNEDLQVNGRQYDFTIGEMEGYALLTALKGVNRTYYEVEELFYNKQSPFENCTGLPVYITHNLYLDYYEDTFYNVVDNSVVDDALIEEYAYKGFGYRGGTGEDIDVTQTVSYATKSTQTYSIQYDLPNYQGSIDGITSCANTAGAVVIGYYDRFYQNLIPNYQSYVQLGSVIRYKTTSSEIFDVVESLYSLMETDVNYLGTTFEGFQTGMNAYVTGKGYTYTTTNMFTNGSLNMASYKNAVENGKPVAMFLTTYAFVNSITEGSGVDTIESGYSSGSHVVVGCGYRIDTYYNENGDVINTRNYLKVASGLMSYDIGYLNINGLGNLDRAISVQIS